MIKLTLREAMAASQALQSLPKINAKAAYDLARIRDRLKPILRPLGEQERALIIEHGGEINDAGGIKWPTPKKGKPDAQKTYAKAWADLLDKEETVDREPVKLSDILGPDPAKYPEIAPEILSMLEKIIVE
jgi:hypothetical protein